MVLIRCGFVRRGVYKGLVCWLMIAANAEMCSSLETDASPSVYRLPSMYPTVC